MTTNKIYLFLAVLCLSFNAFGQNTAWSASGSIGIGTTSPVSSFQVYGSNATLWGLTLGTGISSAIITSDVANKPIVLQVGGTEAMRVNGSGYIGIGTTSPAAVLDVGTYLPAGSLGTVMARLSEGSTTGAGTYLGVKGYNTQLTGSNTNLQNVVSFAIEHSFYGVTNSSINFLRGGNQTGGSIAFNISNNTEVMRLMNGNVLIGQTAQTNGSYRLDVAGSVRANQITVNTNGADFVFNPSYKLHRLSYLKKYIEDHHHLPDISSAADMQKDGLNLGDNQTKLLQKVEELTLYLIEDNRQLQEQRRVNLKQEARIKRLEHKFDKLSNAKPVNR